LKRSQAGGLENLVSYDYQESECRLKAMPGKADKAEQEKFLRLIEAKLAENTEQTGVYYRVSHDP
jgi:hypothetical protein